jgi:hypothetical protein
VQVVRTLRALENRALGRPFRWPSDQGILAHRQSPVEEPEQLPSVGRGKNGSLGSFGRQPAPVCSRQSLTGARDARSAKSRIATRSSRALLPPTGGALWGHSKLRESSTEDPPSSLTGGDRIQLALSAAPHRYDVLRLAPGRSMESSPTGAQSGADGGTVDAVMITL